MIISKTALVTLNSSNIKHFQFLGYKIPTYRNNYYRTKIKRGTKIKVKIEHLLPNSEIKILCQCDFCKNIKLVAIDTLMKSYNYKKFNKYFCANCISKNEISKEKISKKMSGKNNPKYNHNLTEEERKKNHNIIGIYNWKNKVKKHDNYTCQKCGYKGKKLDGIMESHHINNFSHFKDQRTDINNGITLCKKCHKIFHKLYGQKSNKKYFSKFLKSKI